MSVKSKLIIGLSVVLVFAAGSTSAGAFPLTMSKQAGTGVQASAPSTPDNFRLMDRKGSKLHLNWDWVSGGVGSIHYELAYGGKTIVLNQYYPGTIRDVSDVDLSPGHTYTFSLWAVDELGQRSPAPARLQFETTPPTAPSNLQQESTRLSYPDIISFTLSSDNVSTIRAYEAFLNGVSFGIIMRNGNEFSLFEQVSQAYQPVPRGATSLQLRAYDESLNPSALSAPLTVVFP